MYAPETQNSNGRGSTAQMWITQEETAMERISQEPTNHKESDAYLIRRGAERDAMNDRAGITGEDATHMSYGAISALLAMSLSSDPRIQKYAASETRRLIELGKE